MTMERSHIIWVPRNGNGRVHTFFLSPVLIRVLAFMLVLCVAAIPVLESGLLALAYKVHDLENRRQLLHVEVQRLQNVKRSLGRIEKNEQMLMEYFGMDRFPSVKTILGVGGNPMYDEKSYAKGEQDTKGRSEGIILPGHLAAISSNYKLFRRLLNEQGERWDETPSIFPVDIKAPKISSPFGWRRNPFTEQKEFHAGIDIIGTRSTRIIAPARGVVINLGSDRWLGNYVVLQHTNHVKTIYGHLSRATVKKGLKVGRGDIIGYMGNTGLSTSTHLHYSVVVKNRAVDPMQYILVSEGA